MVGRFLNFGNSVHHNKVKLCPWALRKLTKASKWSADHWYNFACIYAVASGQVPAKKQEYADRAMELLQKAVESGWKDADHVAKDGDLDVLRDREDFKKLLAANPVRLHCISIAKPLTPAFCQIGMNGSRQTQSMLR